MLIRYLLILTSFFLLELSAVEGKIKVYVKSDVSVYTSQKTTVAVELLSDAFSITDAKINFATSDKYIVQAPQSASYLGQTEVNGTDWQMVHYEYEVYALRAGEIEIAPFSVSFTASMGYGQPKKEFTLKSEALHFTVKTPESVKPDDFALVTDNYLLSSTLKPEKRVLIVGDALEFSVTQKAHNVPDILLQPVRYKSTSLLRVYDKEPILQHGLKGAYDVTRTDTFTFVASAEGNVTLPAHAFLWWSTQSKQLKREKIPAFTFEIRPDPQIALDAQKEKQKQILLYLFAFVLMILILYRISAKHIKKYINDRKEAYAKSEKGQYALLVHCIEKGKLSEVYTQFYIWIDTIICDRQVRTFKDIYEEYPEFEDLFATFERALLQDAKINSASSLSILGKLRKTLLDRHTKAANTLQRTINP